MDSLRSEAATRLIVEIAAAASGELDLDQILHEALDRLRRVVRLTGGSIALVEGDDLVVRAAVGPFAEEALGQRLSRGPSRSWGVIERLQPFRTGDLARDGGKMRGAEAARAVHSWLAVPIARRGLGIGLLEVDSTEPDAFEPADEELLSGVVAVLAGHVELAAHHEADVRSAELREAFVGVISHELRTPITTIYGLARILRQRGESLEPGARADAIADIEAESERLYRLVEDLLVLSRAEGGRVAIEAEPINMTRLVRRRCGGPASARSPVSRLGSCGPPADRSRDHVRRAGRPELPDECREIQRAVGGDRDRRRRDRRAGLGQGARSRDGHR
jgi:K+-sensing histidine kinase KdpD